MNNICEIIKCPYYQNKACTGYSVSSLCHLLENAQDSDHFAKKKLNLDGNKIEVEATNYVLLSNCNQESINKLKEINDLFLSQDKFYLKKLKFKTKYNLK